MNKSYSPMGLGFRVKGFESFLGISASAFANHVIAPGEAVRSHAPCTGIALMRACVQVDSADW